MKFHEFGIFVPSLDILVALDQQYYAMFFFHEFEVFHACILQLAFIQVRTAPQLFQVDAFIQFGFFLVHWLLNL